jgi:hypothetical protein
MDSLYKVLDFLFAMCMPIIMISVICTVLFIATVCSRWTEDFYYYDYEPVKKNKINFYHPMIRQTYYDLLEHEKKTNEVRSYLIKQNNHMNQFYPYNKMEDRLKQIEKNHAIQTIFNYLKFEINKVN